VVTVNNGATVAFLNNASARWLRVRVPGESAAGAKVTLKRGKLPAQSLEVHAGGGYLAQDSACAFFGLGDDESTGTVTVQWADGTTSEAVYDGKSPTLSSRAADSHRYTDESPLLLSTRMLCRGS
jgi:hypothetical protein